MEIKTKTGKPKKTPSTRTTKAVVGVLVIAVVLIGWLVKPEPEIQTTDDGLQYRFDAREYLYTLPNGPSLPRLFDDNVVVEGFTGSQIALGKNRLLEESILEQCSGCHDDKPLEDFGF